MKLKSLFLAFIFSQITSFATSSVAKDHHHGHHGGAQSPPQVVTSESLYNADVKLLDQNGKTVPLSSLRGEPVIISMAYTGCAYTCPMILSQMQQIEKKLITKGKKNVKFVLVSFDYQRDTPKVLAEYAKKRSLGKSWQLFTATSDKEPRTIANLLGIKYQKSGSGDFDHSFVISALNRDGEITFQQIGAKEESDKLITAVE